MERLPECLATSHGTSETARTSLQKEKSDASQALSFVDPPHNRRPLHNCISFLPQVCRARWICPKQSCRQPFTKHFLHIRPIRHIIPLSHGTGELLLLLCR